MSRLPLWLRQHVAALRTLLVFTVVLGIAYPLVITGIAQIPGLKHRADGSPIKLDGKVVGSAVIGQAFTDAKGNPIPKYFQSRPSDAGDGYDPTATGASNLGPESIVDTLPDPTVKGDTGTQSLLTQVCTRSLAVGQLEGVDGRRPYCTADGLGAVLSVIHENGLTGPIQQVVSVNQACPAEPFITTYEGVRVQCAKSGVDYSVGPNRADPRAGQALARQSGTAGRGHCEWQRSGPGHLCRVRRPAGAPGSPRPQPAARHRAERDQEVHLEPHTGVHG